MAVFTKCQTSGAIFSTSIKNDQVSISVKLPFKLDLTEDEAEILESNMHNVMELVLKPYFRS